MILNIQCFWIEVRDDAEALKEKKGRNRQQGKRRQTEAKGKLERYSQVMGCAF